MSRPLICGLLTVIPLALATGMQASAADEPRPVPQSSTDRFLGGVRDFAGGKPSPNILYSTREVGEAAHRAGAASSKGAPSVVLIDSKRSSAPLASSKLNGGTLDRRQITPTPITPTPITPQQIQPYSVTSPWNQ